MVINTGTWMDERLQQRGNGRMNLEAAMQTPVTAVPPSVSYLTSGSTVNESRDFTLTNIGRTAQTFQIAVVPLSAGPAPVLTSESEVTLDAGQSTTVRTLLAASDLPAGERNGLFVVKASGGAQILVPYWHGVPDNVPAVISFPSKPTSVTPGATTTVFMRLLDAAGMVAVGPVPQITVETPGAAAVQLFTGGTSRPGFWAVSVRAQPTEGILTVLVRAGNAEGRVQIPVF
jgi:hypothetical protein